MPEAWLVLETSGRGAKIGLARDGTVRHSVTLDDTRRHARDLASTVNGMLKEESLLPRDVTGVMVGLGPGSYTGLRVGLISAKAFAFATECKFVAVETFTAIAGQAPHAAQKLWVIADALQGQVYLQRFTRSDVGWQAVDELRIERAVDCLNAATAGTWITGPGVKVYAERIPQDCGLVPEADREARIESVFAVGLRTEPFSREAMFTVEPLYLRGSSAEEKAKQ